jgi:hypothetical protein
VCSVIRASLPDVITRGEISAAYDTIRPRR